jgi:chromosome segregation ATPase
METNQQKRWANTKKTLAESTLKALKENKLDFGDTLEKFEKLADSLRKELAEGEASKKASTYLDALKKNHVQIEAAIKAYTVILNKHTNTDTKVGVALTVLRKTLAETKDEMVTLANGYADAAQGLKDFTIEKVIGSEAVTAIKGLSFHKSAPLGQFCSNTAFVISPAAFQSKTRDPRLEKLQLEAAGYRDTMLKAIHSLQACLSKTYPTQDQAFSEAQKYSKILCGSFGAPTGLLGTIGDWIEHKDKLARGTAYPESQFGQSVQTQVLAAAKAVTNDEAKINEISYATDRKR